MKISKFNFIVLLLFLASSCGAASSDQDDPGLIDSSTSILYGFWGMNTFSDSPTDINAVAADFNATVFQVASSDPEYAVNQQLPDVEDSLMKVTMRLTEDHESYTDGSGNFDIGLWKSDLDRWTAIDVGGATYADEVLPFIENGTLVGHMLLDDIYTFAGNPPTGDELDEMASYSQTIFPGLMTFVRAKASDMPIPSGGSYEDLDACVNQYTNYPGFSDGDVTIYAETEAQTALDLNLQIINGMNIADGGDGSSGQLGATAAGSSGIPKYAMTATEITTYGTALLAHGLAQDPIMFLMWEYDGSQIWQDGSIGSDYFSQADIAAALAGLGTLAAEF